MIKKVVTSNGRARELCCGLILVSFGLWVDSRIISRAANRVCALCVRVVFVVCVVESASAKGSSERASE